MAGPLLQPSTQPPLLRLAGGAANRAFSLAGANFTSERRQGDLEEPLAIFFGEVEGLSRRVFLVTGKDEIVAAEVSG
jgi:hypothetical protein